MERERERLGERLERDQKRMHLSTEAALLTDFFARFAALPAAQRVPAVEAFLAGARDREAIRPKVDALLAGTKVTDLAERKKMFAESAEQLRARKDPLLDLAFSLDTRAADPQGEGGPLQGRDLAPAPAMAAGGDRPRGQARGPGRQRHPAGHPRPRPGLQPQGRRLHAPATTISGVVEKHTGEEPFDAPDALLAAAPRAARSRWADPELKDVPVCFLADADTTGGNSGSPVVNGRGELVGVNFDRVWENVANDFGYNPDVARNISVDVRYLLWLLEAYPRRRGAADPHRDGREPVRRLLVPLLGFLVLAACQAPPPEAPAAETRAPSPAPVADTLVDPDPLVNTVWVRLDEGAPLGDMRIFLADGTLVLDSCWEVYALRSWRRTSKDEIVMVEDVEIPARIVALSPDELRLSLALMDGSRQEVAYRRGTVPYVCPEMKQTPPGH